MADAIAHDSAAAFTLYRLRLSAIDGLLLLAADAERDDILLACAAALRGDA